MRVGVAALELDLDAMDRRVFDENYAKMYHAKLQTCPIVTHVPSLSRNRRARAPRPAEQHRACTGAPALYKQISPNLPSVCCSKHAIRALTLSQCSTTCARRVGASSSARWCGCKHTREECHDLVNSLTPKQRAPRNRLRARHAQLIANNSIDW